MAVYKIINIDYNQEIEQMKYGEIIHFIAIITFTVVIFFDKSYTLSQLILSSTWLLYHSFPGRLNK